MDLSQKVEQACDNAGVLICERGSGQAPGMWISFVRVSFVLSLQGFRGKANEPKTNSNDKI